SSSAEPDGFLLCCVPSHNDRARFPPGELSVASRSFGTRALLHTYSADPDGWYHDCFAAHYASALSGSVAAKNDGSGHALVHVVHTLECPVWFVTLLVGWKY